MMKALIDPKIIDTPIGQCVTLPSATKASPKWWSHDDFIPGDLLAVVQTCPNATGCSRAADWHGIGFGPAPDCPCEKWRSIHIRRGFVRVLKVLPVVEFIFGNEALSEGVEQVVVHDEGTCYWDGSGDIIPLSLSVSPGDVVLVVEPWCLWIEDGPIGHNVSACHYCKPTPVILNHNDGVLGEIGDET